MKKEDKEIEKISRKEDAFTELFDTIRRDIAERIFDDIENIEGYHFDTKSNTPIELRKIKKKWLK